MKLWVKVQFMQETNGTKMTMTRLRFGLKKGLRPTALVMSAGLLAGCTLMPTPFTDAELTSTATMKIESVIVDQEPIVGKITLYNAMARALKYNLDYKVELLRELLAEKNLQFKSASMLPSLIANSGYASRNSENASYSRNLATGNNSVHPTYSKDKGSFSSDVTFTWHVLDFGLSYIRAKQAGDEALIASERKRKIVNKIIEDVRVAYWRAVSADRLLSGFRSLRGRVEKALRQSKHLYKLRQTSPVKALIFQRELVNIKRQIHRLERELQTSKMQLAALMNVNPGQSFALHIPKRRLTDLAIKASGEEMVVMALKYRPEMREAGYAERINLEEIKVALLELLPGISLYGGTNFDSNQFLFNSNWISYGAKVGWNLMKVFQYPARKSSVEARQELLRQRALATTMAIMTQVYVSRARYKHLHRSAKTAAEYYSIQRKLRAQARAAVKAKVGSRQTLIREEMNTLVAAVQYDLAYADLQNAFAAIYAAVGADPFDLQISRNTSIEELVIQLKETWRLRGDKHL